MNVDEQGNRINPGQLEITEFDLVLYQRGKPPIKWPLRTLRRYGFDAEHFSFESGRRCQTGPGIYAFQCRRAEQLFNLLQSRIQTRTNGETDGTESLPNFALMGSNRESNYLEPAPLRRSNPGSRFSSQNGMTRLSSIGSASGSAGPLSPQSTTSPPLPLDAVPLIPALPINRPLSQNLYANEEIIAAVTQDLEETNNNKTVDEPISPPFEHSYSNSAVLESLPVMDLNNQTSDNQYNLLEEVSSPSHDNSHLYMNIVPGTDNVIPKFPVKPSQSTTNFVPVPVDWEPEEPFHNYANCDADGSLPRRLPGMPLPTTPTGEKSLNYIVLDLEPSSDPPKSPTNSLPPDSPRKPTSGYAAIDFKKTVALSHSVNPTFDKECSRKTRHNSNINDLLSQTRQSSSVSD